jgi:pimeloyl-ACP methyl ester carboxylesterase
MMAHTVEHTLALPRGGLVSWDAVGPRDAGTTVILLHGFPHDRGLWTNQAQALDSAFPDTRLLIPDLPGFGRSTPPSESTMDAYADAVAAVLDASGVGTAVVGGLSMGGYVTLAFWRRHPSRVGALLLMDTKATADAEPARAKRQALIADVAREGVGPTVPSLIPGQLGKTTRETQPALVERVEVMLRRAPEEGVICAATAMMNRIDSTPTLDTITVPTLVIVGDEDALTPVSDAIAMSSLIRGSRLVTIAGAGHLSPLEAPDVVNAAIAEFLDVSVRSA